MSNKLGDLPIVLTILVFVIGGFTAFIIGANNSIDISNNNLEDIMGNLTESVGGMEDLEKEFTTKTDETGTFNVEEENSLLEQRGSDSAGILNIASKNVLFAFFKELPKVFVGSGYVIAFLTSIVGISASILLLRFFWGDNKI